MNLASFQTNPSGLLNPTGWYSVVDLGDLFGTSPQGAELLFGPDQIVGASIVSILTNAAAGAGGITPGGMTAGTVAAFKAKYPWTP
jgi:hypothetical protein